MLKNEQMTDYSLFLLPYERGNTRKCPSLIQVDPHWRNLSCMLLVFERYRYSCWVESKQIVLWEEPRFFSSMFLGQMEGFDGDPTISYNVAGTTARVHKKHIKKNKKCYTAGISGFNLACGV